MKVKKRKRKSPIQNSNAEKNNMKIVDLYENDFKDKLNGEIMNILMMVMKTNTPETDVENVIAELEKHDIVVSSNDIEEFVDENNNFSMTSDGKIVFSSEASEDLGGERPDLETEDEYNPARDKAKQATKKRSK